MASNQLISVDHLLKFLLVTQLSVVSSATTQMMHALDSLRFAFAKVLSVSLTVTVLEIESLQIISKTAVLEQATAFHFQMVTSALSV